MKKFLLLLGVFSVLSFYGYAISPLKIGFLYVGPVGDEGWSYAHDLGRRYLEKEFGELIETVYYESVPEGAETGTTIETAIREGCTVIFGTSFGYMDAIYEYASLYPNLNFFHCSGYKTASNMTAYFGRIYEPSFLAGIVAGSMTESGKIGYVAPVAIPEVIRITNAFALGVRLVNESARVHVLWTHSWYDPVMEKKAANDLIDGGCDVLAQQTDSSVPVKVAEARGIWMVGYNSDMSCEAPTKMLTSAVWNWGIYYRSVLSDIFDGTYHHQDYWKGMEEGIVSLTPLSEAVPETVNGIVQDYENRIVSGSYHPFQGPIYAQSGTLKVPEGSTMTDNELLSMNWFIDTVVGDIP
jgi:basic membrane protein A